MEIKRKPCHRILALFAGLGVCAVGALSGCGPTGYIKADDLIRRGQGPQHCAASCEELGMEMGAMVLVSNSLPGCVCQPKGARSSSARDGASSSAVSHAVMMAAAAAAHQQQMQMQQAQQQNHR